MKLLVSGVSQRRAARVLSINPKTVVRKFLFLSGLARLRNQEFRNEFLANGIRLESIHFDEMESFEHSKCLPLSIPLAVQTQTRKILGFRVCEMPAKGPLAKISRKKYGLRRDGRAKAADSLFSEIAPLLLPRAEVRTDQNPHYPRWIRRRMADADHQAHEGKRGCIVGQGELKKIGFDPLFDLNHTCAMLRANINRLFRKTWCTTKKRDRLADHIELYAYFHNAVLT